MKAAFLLSLYASLAASSALAQAPAANAPSSGSPANLCQELLAFVKQPEPANKAAETPVSVA